MGRPFEFIQDPAREIHAHASTIVELETGPAAAFFGGGPEGSAGARILFSRRLDGRWEEPMPVADGGGYGCWNPVLFLPGSGPLLLFFKVGPHPCGWWGMWMRSDDGGVTWTDPEPLPEGLLGPVKNKPVETPDGTLVCPSSTEEMDETSQEPVWRVHLERTPDLGHTWIKGPALNGPRPWQAIQPSLLCWSDRRWQLLCRSRQGVIAECWSEDGGETWRAMRATALPNPNSGTDAVRLADGRAVLVYNHSNGPSRRPLTLAVSDDGVAWRAARVLEDEDGSFSYPAVIQTRDGQVHVTWTWNRRGIRHAVFAPEELDGPPLENGAWPH